MINPKAIKEKLNDKVKMYIYKLNDKFKTKQNETRCTFKLDNKPKSEGLSKLY